MPNVQEALKKNAADGFIESSVKITTIDDTTSDHFGEIDESKTPVVGIKLWMGIPKKQSVSHFMIPNTRYALYTKVFDHRNGLSKKPVSSWEKLMELLYTKGLSSETGRRPFRLKATFVLLGPSMYANSDKKTGKLQYKASEIHIFDIEESQFSDEMNSQQFAKIQEQFVLAHQLNPSTKRNCDDVNENHDGTEEEDHNTKKSKSSHNDYFDASDYHD
jgi:hypothetical protein